MIVGLGGCMPSQLVDFGVDGVVFRPMSEENEETARWFALSATTPPVELEPISEDERREVEAWAVRDAAEAETLREWTLSRVLAAKPLKKKAAKKSPKTLDSSRKRPTA